MRVTVQLRSWVQKNKSCFMQDLLCTTPIYYIQKALTDIMLGIVKAWNNAL